MPTPELIKAFLSQASTSGARSTALQPLGWLSVTLTAGVVMSVDKAPQWTIIAMITFLALTILIYLGSYIYFALKNPDALRSEKFTLSKIAIEKNLIGDSNVGLHEMDELSGSNKLSTLPFKEGVDQ